MVKPEQCVTFITPPGQTLESPDHQVHAQFPEVTESGSLSPEHGPAAIRCRAGIGRSGTFALVGNCLVPMEKR